MAFTAALVVQLLWVGYVSVELEVLPTILAYTLLVSLAILATEWSAQRLGTFLSLGILSQKPFDNPLAVSTNPGAPTSKSMIKFKSQFWQLVIHVIMSVLETIVLGQTAQLAGASLFDEPWRCSLFDQPNPPLLETVSGAPHWGLDPWADGVGRCSQVYHLQLAIWMVTAIFHVWVFEAQSDYFVMLGHHIVTIGLVGISFQNGFVRCVLLTDGRP